jgi:hypothetical protein
MEESMSLSNLVSLRQFPEELRLRLQVAYAAAREALIETHQAEALRFTRDFSRRLPPLEALDLYFAAVPVSIALMECVISRTLVALDLDRLPSVAREPSPFAALRTLRLDIVLESLRRHRQFREETLRLARLGGARAADALLDTHVLNAARIAEILGDTVWIDEAVSHYIHSFHLSLPTAYMVYQRTRAMMADRHLERMMAGPTVTISTEQVRESLRLPEQRVRIAG